MPFYGAQGFVDAFQQMPINRLHAQQALGAQMAVEAERRRLAAEPLLGQTWYELAHQAPQQVPLPQPPMPGQQSLPMSQPGPAGMYPPPQVSQLPRPPTLMAGVPPGVPLPPPQAMQGMPLPGPQGMQEPLYRPLRADALGEGMASRLPPLLSLRSGALDTGQTQVPMRPDAQRPVGLDPAGNPTVRAVGEPGVQVILNRNDPQASRGTPSLPVPDGASVVPGGAAAPGDPLAGGMSQAPGGLPAPPMEQPAAGAGAPGAQMGMPSFLQSPDMMEFIRAAKRVGVDPRDLPEMVRSANPIMAKEMAAAQAAQNAWLRTYEAEMRMGMADRRIESAERIAAGVQEGRDRDRELRAQHYADLKEKWERKDEIDRGKLKAYETKARTGTLMNNAVYRSTLEKYKQEMQNWRATMNIINNPMIDPKALPAAFETARDQRARIDSLEEMLNGISGIGETKEGKEVDQPAAGTTQLAAPPIGTVQKGYRFKGGDPGSPGSWEKAD